MEGTGEYLRPMSVEASPSRHVLNMNGLKQSRTPVIRCVCGAAELRPADSVCVRVLRG